MVREDEEGSSSEQKFCNALFHLGRKLFQLYIVDSYIRAENSDLRFLRSHTKQLKVDKYCGSTLIFFSNYSQFSAQQHHGQRHSR